MTYLRYLCLFAYSSVQHILCCVFVVIVFVMCNLCCQFLWIIHFLLLLRYSLTFMKVFFMTNINIRPLGKVFEYSLRDNNADCRNEH